MPENNPDGGNKKNKDKKIDSNRKQNVHEFYTYDGVHS